MGELSSHGNCHSIDIAITPTVFSCQICATICKGQLEFFEHLKTHYEPVTNNIKEPPTLIKSEINKDSLLSSLLPPLNCLQCGKNFKRQKAFEAHIRDVHTNNKIEDEFSEPEDLMEGIRSVVEANDRESSDESPDNKEWYQQNISCNQSVLGMNLQEQICHLCGQVFSTYAEVIQHIQECKSHLPTNVAQLIENDKQTNRNRKKRRRSHLSCPHCDRVFSHRNSLMYHMQGHTGERPHQCDICGKSFFASSALKVNTIYLYYLNYIFNLLKLTYVINST